MHFFSLIKGKPWACLAHKSLLVVKLTFVLIIAALLQVSASSLAQKVTLNKKASSLQQIFKDIRNQTGFNFVYTTKLIKQAKPVTIQVQDASLYDVLQQCFAEQPFTYELADKTIIVKKKAPPLLENIITINVTGRITDEHGLPIPGATIKVKGTTIGVVADVEGKFSINIPQQDNILVISFIGYVTQEVPVAGKTNLSIVLSEQVSKLNEVVVVGFGKQSRELLTSSISKLDTKVLENIPYTNALSALEGTIPGMRVQSISGQPGIPPRVILRGSTSINNPNGSTPLYLIDGVIRTDIDGLAAEDIASIEVLKDASATAIYGARGSNGVILITTKTGKPGATKVEYNYDISRNDKGSLGLKYVGARDYIVGARQSVLWAGVKVAPATTTARLTNASGFGTGNDLTNRTAFTTMYLTPDNEYLLGQGWESVTDPANPAKTIIYKSTDFNALASRIAISQNHHLSVSGGSDKTTFNFGLNDLLGQGTQLNSNYNRLGVNFDGSLQVTKKLNIVGHLLYSTVNDKLINADTQTNFTILTTDFFRDPLVPQTTKLTFEDGTIAPGQGPTIGNPLYYQTGQYAPVTNDVRDNTTIALAGNWKILPGLSFDPQVSLYQQSDQYYSFQPAYLTAITTFNTTRAATSFYNKTRAYQVDAVLTYVKSIADAHHFELKGGFTYYDNNTFSVTASGNGASTDNVPTLNAAPNHTAANGSVSEFATEGVFSRLNYDYKEKYLLSATVRYDGSSSLGSQHRFGVFPGLGLGWNIHKEKFWESVPQVFSNFKLRATYGVNGNISGLSAYTAQGSYAVGYVYSGNGGIIPTVIPNSNLEWEQSKTFDVGADIGVLNNRINIIFDYYYRRTDNLLTNVALPYSSGYSSVLTNDGSLGNKGLELDVNAQIFSHKNAFQWNVNFNVSKIKTRIIKLPDNGVLNNRQGGIQIWDSATNSYIYAGGLQEGGRVGDMFAYKQIGIYPTDAAAAAGPVDMGVPYDYGTTRRGKYAGDVNWEDRDGNGIIDSRDEVYVGNAYPTFTGGFTNNFAYKHFAFTIRTDFETGHTIQNSAAQGADSQGQGDGAPTLSFYQASWKKVGDVTNTPRYLWQDSEGNISRNSSYYQKGDFLCIREVTLSYTLPKNAMFTKLGINSLRLAITGNNLHYFTGYPGNNPEEGGIDYGRYPNPRGIIGSLKVTF